MLAVSSPVLRSASFALFVLFSNGVPFLYTLGIKLSPSSRYHAGSDVPWRYINLWVRAPCTMPHAPCTVPPCTVHHAPCTMHHAPCPTSRLADRRAPHRTSHPPSTLPLAPPRQARTHPLTHSLFYSLTTGHLQALSLGTFALGLGIKSSGLPERLVRRRWSDVFLTSHMLWHVAIHVGFTFGTFLAWDEYLVWRRTHSCAVDGYY